MPKVDFERRNRLFETADKQAGYFTAKQAFQCGYSHRLQHYHKTQGTWLEVERGVYRLVNYPNTPHEDLVRWSMWSFSRDGQPQAVVSHESALSLHEMGDVMPAQIHLTLPSTFRKKPTGGCIVHKARISENQIEHRPGFNVTTPIKTIVDVADSNLGLDELDKAMRDGIRKGYFIPASFGNLPMPSKARRKIHQIIANMKAEAGHAGRS